jgi:hypothetical protein
MSRDRGGEIITYVVFACIFAVLIGMVVLLSQPPDCTPAMEGSVFNYSGGKFTTAKPVQVCHNGVWQDLKLPAQ